MSGAFDKRLAADALGVDPTTLPSLISSQPQAESQPRGPVVTFVPLDDNEWETLERLIPQLPVPRPDQDFRTRDFLDSVIWWSAARQKGHGWAKLPEEYWPISSREHRHRRWCELGWWRQLADALVQEEAITLSRRQTFERIAVDAERRHARLSARRERLTPVTGI